MDARVAWLRHFVTQTWRKPLHLSLGVLRISEVAPPLELQALRLPLVECSELLEKDPAQTPPYLAASPLHHRCQNDSHTAALASYLTP
mmetsp:Transcript_30700/g.60272  ORF Transcript_30700/g.60272 Transcript_30700/m.60272 type:complete len:88 (+) Transcript_30700:1243-1506(+)